MADTAPNLVKQLCDLIARYVVMTPAQRGIVALWIIHTHLVQHCEQTPYLTVTSPQRQCGKSRLAELLDLLTPRPWMSILPTEAVFFRTIHSTMPTILLDEVDAIFDPKVAERHEGLRAAINAGHRQGATVPRCINFGADVQNFNVFSAKALFGIGVLPATITDRSIPIRLKRKTKAERVARFRRREVSAVAGPLRDEIAAWCAAPSQDPTMTNGEMLATWRPEIPDELSDRMQEGCEILVAIADAFNVGKQTRAALVELLTGERLDEKESAELSILRDLRVIFEDRAEAHVVSSQELVFALVSNGNGWADWYGRGLTANDLAALLKPYDVHSKPVRTPEGVRKGYKRDDLADVWVRYLTAQADVTPVTALSEGTHDV